MTSTPKTRSIDPEDTELARGKSVKQYRALRASHDRGGIARLIHQRFSERYYVPSVYGEFSHGFTVMAVSCLMIETIECFRRGLPDSNRGSERMFCDFFQREPQFVPFRPLAHDFYKHVRCGILHQGETTDQWRIHQTGPLLEEQAPVRWINALEFAHAVHRALQAYCKELEGAAETDTVWVHAFTKLRAICRNCGVTNLNGL
jgi:hypothetical protein